MSSDQILQTVLGYSITLLTVFFAIWRWDAKRTFDRDKAIDDREQTIRVDYEQKIEKLTTKLESQDLRIHDIQDSVNTKLRDVVKANTEAMENQRNSLDKLSETQQLEVSAVEALTAGITRLELEIRTKIAELQTKLDVILSFINSKEENSNPVNNTIINSPKLEQ